MNQTLPSSASETNLTEINLFALCREQITRQGSLQLDRFTRLAPDLRHTQGEIHYTVTGSQNAEQKYHLNLSLVGELPMNCQRCAEALNHAFSINNTLELVQNESELDDEEEEINAILEGRSEIEKIVGSTHFNLLELLEDELILGLPLVIAHEQCPTVLPTTSGKAASPFDALEKLR